MSEFGKSFDRAQQHYDNMGTPDEESVDCESLGHRRSTGIPLDDDGKATCRDCGELFDEYDDKKRVEKLRE